MRLSTGVTVTVLVLGAGGVACGSSDAKQSPEPALCGSVDNLDNDISDMNEIDYTSPGGLDQLKQGVSTVQQDLADVAADAKKEFSDDVALAQKSFKAASESVDKAKSNPSSAAIKAIKDSLVEFSRDAQTLISDVQTTC